MIVASQTGRACWIGFGVTLLYEKASTIITSNKAFSDWTELFQDPFIVTALLDRLLHHSVVINMRGNSYRLRGNVGKEGLEMSQS